MMQHALISSLPYSWPPEGDACSPDARSMGRLQQCTQDRPIANQCGDTIALLYCFGRLMWDCYCSMLLALIPVHSFRTLSSHADYEWYYHRCRRQYRAACRQQAKEQRQQCSRNRYEYTRRCVRPAPTVLGRIGA